MRNVAIYVRVSTMHQAEQGYSIDSQLADCRKKAHDLGAITINEYVDKGKSGAFLDRPELQRMLNDIKTEKEYYDALIIYKLDRLSRDSMGLAYIIKILQQKNIKIISTDGAQYGANPQDVLTMQIMGSIAQFDNALRKERSIRGKIEKRKQGKLDKITKYGYTFNDEKQNLDIKEDEAIIIRKIFKWFTEDNLSAFRISKKLNSEKIPAPQPKINRKIINKDNIWFESTIRTMLKDETYAGIRHTMIYKFEKISLNNMKKTKRPPEEWISVPVPSIISRETWDKANNIMNRKSTNPRRTQRTWILQGLVFCEKCGQIMNIKQTPKIGKIKENEEKYNFYFKCRTNILNWFGSDKKCPNRQVPIYALEDSVWETLLNIFYSKETLEKYLKETQLKDNVYNLLDKLIEDRNKLSKNKNKIVEWFADGKIDQEIADNKINDLNNKINDLDKKISNLQSTNRSKKSFSINNLYDIFHKIKNPNREQKKEIIHSVVEKIFVERLDNKRSNAYTKPVLKIRIILR